MKALVVSNCATGAYVHTLKALFPDWEVRGVLFDRAEEWAGARPPHAGFAAYARCCDVYLGVNPARTRYGEIVAQARQVLIPAVWCRGFHPDSFHLPPLVSPLGSGTLFSKIVVAGFAAGLSEAQTASLFNERTYEAFGLFSCFDGEQQDFVNRLRRFGIDIAGSVGCWLARGNFLYTYNHVRVDVLVEIACRALAVAGLLPKGQEEDGSGLGVPDGLAESIIWPVYPEIAARHGVDGALVWRKGRSAGYEAMELGRFVGDSFELLKAQPLPPVAELAGWVEQVKSLT